MTDLLNKTNKELTEIHNGLAQQLGHNDINQWKGKKADLVARIETMQARLDEMNEMMDMSTEEPTEDVANEPTVEQQTEVVEDDMADPCEPEATGNEVDETVPTRTRTIRVAALTHLAEVAYYEDRSEKPSETNVVDADHPKARSVGLPYDEILRRIFEEFPDCETSVACLRWYAVKVRNSEVEEEIYGQYTLPQRRPRAKPAKR